MDLEKRYQDENGNQRNILEMVRRFPEWAANRIQDGERSDDRIAELEEQLYEMTPERDSESRWAKEYHDRVKELEAQLAASKDKICKNCKYWNMNIQTIGYCPEDQSGFCAQIYDKIDVNIDYGSDGYRVKDIETNIMFGCVLFERKQDA